MRFITVVILCACFTFTTRYASSKERYNFRKSEAYKQLSKGDRERLEQVNRDLTMLWGALDRYADDHDGNPPKKFELLVPGYLAELPTDPFATKATKEEKPKHNTPSKDGWGYRYPIGSMLQFSGPDNRLSGPDNRRSWVLASVGLPQFPYLAERGNMGLHILKGLWP